ACMNVYVTVPFQMADDGNASFTLHTLHQALSAARHDDVDVLRHVGEHVAHRSTILSGHQLDDARRQTCRTQPLHQTLVDSRARTAALRATTQDDGIA